MFQIAYCDYFEKANASKCLDACKAFVKEIYTHYPEFGRKIKIHLLLHLVDSMLEFGPTSGFNTERYDVCM